MTQVIPLQAAAQQVVNVLLNGQQTQLFIRQMGAALYMDVSVNDTLIIGGVICEQANVIVRDVYLGFSGDLAFYDTQPDPTLGPLDPTYTGLGSRFILVYFLPSELPPGVS